MILLRLTLVVCVILNKIYGNDLDSLVFCLALIFLEGCAYIGNAIKEKK